MGRIKEVVLDAEESMTVAFKKEQRMSLASCWVKRSFDIVGSIVGLTVLSPAFIVIGALVKREDKALSCSGKNVSAIRESRLLFINSAL